MAIEMLQNETKRFKKINTHSEMDNHNILKFEKCDTQKPIG